LIFINNVFSEAILPEGGLLIDPDGKNVQGCDNLPKKIRQGCGAGRKCKIFRQGLADYETLKIKIGRCGGKCKRKRSDVSTGFVNQLLRGNQYSFIIVT
jgi:hypothetical protein